MRKTAEDYLDDVRAFVLELKNQPDEYEAVYEGGMPVGSVKCGKKEFVTAEEIAEKLNIPKHFVTQCLHKLNFEGLVNTRTFSEPFGPGERSPKIYYLRKP